MVTIPIFPLRAVLFPGAVTGLHIFEDRYRALMRDLLEIAEPRDRTFGIVAIRAGSEVGPEVPQLYPVGTVVQVTESTRDPSGTFEIQVVGLERFRLTTLLVGGEYMTGEIEVLTDDLTDTAADQADLLARAETIYQRYREVIGDFVELPPLPALHDPGFLAYAIASNSPISRLAQQEVLACDRPTDRLRAITRTLADEILAIRAIPSLPAVETAPPRWPVN